MTRCTFSLWLFNFYVGYIIWYGGLHSSQAGIKIDGRNINIHGYEDNTALMAESKEELKCLLMRRGDEKTGLKLNIQKTLLKIILNIHGIRSHHIMAYRWGKRGNSGRFYFPGLQNHNGPWLQPKIKRHLLLGRKRSYEKPAQCILKQSLTLIQRSVASKLWYFQ